MGQPLQVVWFKRDLRDRDHRPLVAAARRGPVAPLYVVEPKLWREPDASARHWWFIRDCLVSLDRDLARLGQGLILRVGDMINVLEELRRSHGVAGLWSQEETGGAWTFARDRRVAAWAAAQGIEWREIRQDGVQRRLASRDGWAAS